MASVHVNGVDLEYTEYGAGDLMVVSAQQDFGLSTSYLERLAEPPHNCHVYAIRLRRLSRDDVASQATPPRWYARWAEDVFAATEALGLRSFVYTGVSHGGGIGWHLAIEHPEVLRGLVAIVGVPQPRERRAGPRLGRASLMASRDDPTALRAVVERLFGPTREPGRLARREALVQRTLERFRAADPAEAAIELGINLPDFETDEALLAALATVTVPTLVLGGMADPWATPELCLRMTRAVSGAKLVLFQDEGHMLSTESPDKILGEMQLFLDGLARSRYTDRTNQSIE